MSEQIKKPPIGLIPRKLWLEVRLVDIKQAIDRYTEAGQDIPEAWREESELLKIEIDS